MNNNHLTHRPAVSRGFAAATRRVALAVALGLPVVAQAQAPFATPQAAADALIDAVMSNDEAAMARVLGSDWRRLIPVGQVAREDLYAFLEKSSQSRTVNVTDGRGELVVGKEPWTLPIPLAQTAGGSWRFDTVAARELIFERRIGANERAAINATLAYVDAQREYAQADRNGNGVLEYAQKLVSSPGQRDGLIWSTRLGDESPLGEAFLPKQRERGYHGYHYKILTAQGPKAAGGARNYIIGQRLRAGFALLAWPVKYGETGIMSFMVNGDGVVFQRDLGPATPRAAAAIQLFNPDEGWTPTRP